MLSGIQLWFYGTDHMFLSRQSTTTSFEGTPIDPIVPSDYNVVKPGRSYQFRPDIRTRKVPQCRQCNSHCLLQLTIGS